MHTGRLIYVTGISGTDVRKALGKFITWLQDERHDKPTPHVLYLEDELQVIALHDVNRLLGRKQTHHTDIEDVLCLPKPFLDKHWRIAYRQTLNKAHKLLQEGHDVFLSFHACWYHLGTQEYMSSISFPDLHPASFVITFIDDIYDVLIRLNQRFGILHARRAQESVLLDVILKLLFIITWRAFEITLAKRVADSTGAKHFLFATKHPCSTLSSLVFDNKPIVYLSHHITDLRERLAIPDKHKEAQRLIQEIQEFASVLRTEVTLFEPTTIDEGRLTRMFVTGEKYLPRDDGAPIEIKYDTYLPHLLPRWPFAANTRDLLYDEHSTMSESRLIFGEEANNDSTLYLANKDSLSKEQLKDISNTSQLLRPLQELILEQINARDHLLVEQSQVVVPYRPWMSGRSARGVKHEIEHQRRLVSQDEVERRTIMFHPETDETLRQRSVAEEWLSEQISTGQLRYDIPDDKPLKQLHDEQFWHDFKQARAVDFLHLGAYIKDTLQCYPPSSPRSALDISRSSINRNAEGRLGEDLVSAMMEDITELGSEIESINQDLTASRAAHLIARKVLASTRLSKTYST